MFQCFSSETFNNQNRLTDQINFSLNNTDNQTDIFADNMQVGTTSSNIGLTEDAMDVIVELVKLDGEQLKEKAIFFEQLYKLWMSDDLVTSDNISRTFDANKKVIKETILKTLDPKELEYHKTVELAHKTLLGGMPFTNPATQIVHASCEIEIKRFERLRKKNRNTLD